MPTDRGQILLPIARAAISGAVGSTDQTSGVGVDTGDAPWLQELGASFVTLTQKGDLRGCIGTLEARRPLVTDVRANAVAAALHDPRFAPLTLTELIGTDIEVSLLSPMQALSFDGAAEAMAQLRPGLHGVVFEFERYRSTFLPQVWEQLATPQEFMAQLKRKAGLSPDFWAPGVRLQVYTVTKWRENEAP